MSPLLHSIFQRRLAAEAAVLLPIKIASDRGALHLGSDDHANLLPTIRAACRLALYRRGASAALIPQDPLTALNPSRRIGPQITNRLVDILGWSRAEAEAQKKAMNEAVDDLKDVLKPSTDVANDDAPQDKPAFNTKPNRKINL